MNCKSESLEVVKFLVKQKKSAFFYADELNTSSSVDIESDYITADLLPNSIVELEGVYTGKKGLYSNAFRASRIVSETYAQTDKPRIEVECGVVKIGDLIDGAPVMAFGQPFVKKGKKVCYAYFNLKNKGW